MSIEIKIDAISYVIDATRPVEIAMPLDFMDHSRMCMGLKKHRQKPMKQAD